MSLEAIVRGFLGSGSENQSPGSDHPDATLNLINQMLMEDEQEDDKLCTSQALLAIETSFSDALGEQSSINPHPTNHKSPFKILSNETREKKSRPREECTDSLNLTQKLVRRDEPLEVYDDVLLLSSQRMNLSGHHKDAKKRSLSKDRTVRGSKRYEVKEVVDLTTILTQCAQAVVKGDVTTSNAILVQIRRSSSPYGDGNERLAHYVANALEARLNGTGPTIYSDIEMSKAVILRACRILFKCCPFVLMSNLYANNITVKLAEKATRLHVIDFGTLYGFQWPCLMQKLSGRAGGPPRLRITGITYPQPGYRLAEGIEKTGSGLATYAKQFKVPFEFAAVAKKWEDIKLDDFRFDEDEVLVVNCMHGLRHLSDEAVAVGTDNSRDAILNLMNRINPDMLILGIVNGSYNGPFFLARFRGALFQFSAAFDMLQSTLPREEVERMFFEKEVIGRDIMNIVACEGTERVERPESYKQSQVRNRRAGFRELPLNQEIVEEVTTMVKRYYHRDFVVEKDGNWLLQGWKGRILHALSCWKPLKKES